ncbi:MAG: SOS response-associated peptidase [Methanoregula sp.]|nr:SOS response-associated peptidase [Methanoregula sp.]
MCGRYSLIFIDDLGNRFRVFNPMIGARSRFNIAPGNVMPVIVNEDNNAIKNYLVMMKWGLVSPWTQKIRNANSSINARAETLNEKPSFANLLENRRCLVPASGFFEWKKEGTKKIPFYINLPKSPLFAFAGLYNQWIDPDGQPIFTYTIITVEPNQLIAKIHNRMPAILSRENEDRWLSKIPLSSEDLKEILTPCPAENLSMYPVSLLVNSVLADDERVVRPANSLQCTLD